MSGISKRGGAHERNEQPLTRLVLSLSDLTLNERFEGRPIKGVVPAHEFFVKAQWGYRPGSKKLLVDGHDMVSGSLFIQLKKDRDWHSSFGEYNPLNILDFSLYIYDLPEDMFTLLVTAVRSGRIQEATLVLDVDVRGRDCHLIFKSMDIMHENTVSKETISRPTVTISELQREFRKAIREFRISLYTIAILLLLIFLSLRQTGH